MWKLQMSFGLWEWIGIYAAAVNVIAFLLFGLDKYKAKRRKWRIPETALVTVAFLGGSLGALAGMSLFHHKTRHRKFTIWIPVFLLLHGMVLLFVYVFC
ncbi:MAG: DUF1294 domain-containing protein [Blautia sp.]|jgi:uncharacterized membrane protein YsdA (DUF1294 family)